MDVGLCSVLQVVLVNERPFAPVEDECWFGMPFGVGKNLCSGIIVRNFVGSTDSEFRFENLKAIGSQSLNGSAPHVECSSPLNFPGDVEGMVQALDTWWPLTW